MRPLFIKQIEVTATHFRSRSIHKGIADPWREVPRATAERNNVIMAQVCQSLEGRGVRCFGEGGLRTLVIDAANAIGYPLGNYGHV